MPNRRRRCPPVCRTPPDSQEPDARDDHGRGAAAGGVPIADLIAIATAADSTGFGVLAAVGPLLNGSGDLERGPDGTCAKLSSARTFSAVGAFLHERAAPER